MSTPNLQPAVLDEARLARLRALENEVGTVLVAPGAPSGPWRT